MHHGVHCTIHMQCQKVKRQGLWDEANAQLHSVSFVIQQVLFISFN
jgi:hypothetical protein